MDKKNLKKWFIFGSMFIIILGTLSHFFYDWSGESKILGIFVPVNESVWEHVKLALFPSLLLFFIRLFFLKDNKNFIIATFFSVLTMVVLIPSLFYLCIFIVGKDQLILNILNFIVSVITGEYIFYIIMKKFPLNKTYKVISVLGLILILSMYFTFTLFPPKISIFEDPVTNTYGFE